jgi:hypothetical protein
MATAVFRELRRRGETRLWMLTDHQHLFEGNPDCSCALPGVPRTLRLLSRLKVAPTFLYYADYDPIHDREPPPQGHIISTMCRRAGVTGQIALRPYVFLNQAEQEGGRRVGRQIAIQTSGLSAKWPMLNKEWMPGRFQQVVDALRADFDFVHIGSATDAPLEGVLDLRGRTTLRETAAILGRSLVFVGLVGALMHLARAVDCRSVIVYGGREPPVQTGYSSNANLASHPPCSPCWQRNLCAHDHRCMESIPVEDVVEAVRRQVSLHGVPLPVDSDFLN